MILWNLDLLFDDPGMFFTVIPLAIMALLPMLVFHEVSHGFVANWLGDDTAKIMGRLSLNPLAHLDKVGTLMLLFVGFGWAKPVPINPYRLGMDPRKGMAIVGAAGPLSNFLGAAVFSIPFRLDWLQIQPDYSNLAFSDFPSVLFQLVVFINVILGILNLIPVPPLDGFRIAVGFLPAEQAASLARAERYAPQILLGLVIIIFLTGALGYIAGTIANLFLGHELYG